MNKRKTKKDKTKEPSNRDRVKYWKKAYISLDAEHTIALRRNSIFLEKLSASACEMMKLRRSNKNLFRDNTELVNENILLERENTELSQEVARLRLECEKPLWKRVLRK